MAEKWSYMGSVPERYRLGRIDVDRDQTDIAMYVAGLLGDVYPESDGMVETFDAKIDHFAATTAMTREIVNGPTSETKLEVDQAEDCIAMVGIEAVMASRRARQARRDG